MAFTHLSTQTVSGSVATSINFTSISQSYQHLLFKGHCASTDHKSGTQYAYDLYEIQFNGSSAAKYQYTDVSSIAHNTGSFTSGNNEGSLTALGGTNSYFLCQWGDPNTETGGGSQTSSCYGDMDMWLFNYKNPDSQEFWSPVLWESYAVGDNASDYWGRGWGAGNWNDGAAITAVEFGLTTGSFAVGSVISMYGLEAS